MQLIDGRPVFAATDLVGYLACEHLTALDRAALGGLVRRPERHDPELEIIRRRGFEHEGRFLADLRAMGRTIRTIEPDGYSEDRGERLRLAQAATTEAMAEGVDVVYQATFFDGRWRGHADFLLRVESPGRPSRWGPYHYEVADTKLARHVKAGAVLQICSYVEQLERIQGVRPEWMHVALGGSARAVERLRVDDYLAYYRSAKDRFERVVLGAEAPAPAYPLPMAPEPVEHCDVCRWAADCGQRRRADDHLSLVAGIGARQRRALRERGVSTLAALGELPPPIEPPLEGTSATAFARARDQARIQLRGRRAGHLLHELLLPVEAERGLATLPPPSPGDLFVDLEGDPYALDDGVDYLFGVLDVEGRFVSFWSRDDGGDVTLAGEKHAFEAFIDHVMARLTTYPDMHVYHYAPYEPTALKRLMGRHATREAEVDRLLRGGVLVDLYRAVRQGLRASVESYSIKRLEPLYGFRREVDLRDAGGSIVAFEEWLELGAGERPSADQLERIERYNRDDVTSNARLRDWLEELRREAAIETGVAQLPRPAPREAAPSATLGEEQARVEALAERLTAGVPTDPRERTDAQAASWLLAQLLSWHRREDKSFWWLYYHLVRDLSDLERVDAAEPLAGLEYVGVVGAEARSLIHRYSYPVQEHEVRVGMDVRDPATERSPGSVVAIDEARHTVDLRRGQANVAPHPRALVPYERYETDELEAALLRIGESVADRGIGADGPYRAARDLLMRRAPRVGQRTGAPLRLPGERDVAAARRLALRLDRTVLPIQGPPGSGKTYTGARMIIDLLAAGRRVGITATSHKVISHFLDKVCEAAEEAEVELAIGQKAKEAEACRHRFAKPVQENADLRDALTGGEVQLAAGTAWLWSRAEFADTVDVLFVDEAGQMSLANVVAVSGAAASLVLLGDPQQLDQPLKGTHPPGAERSALAHLLGDLATMPADRGLFLETTWRLHPDVCRFTSESFYDGRLTPEPHLARQALHAAPPLAGTGVRYIPVEHVGADSESPEEARAVAEVARSLVEDGATWVDPEGRERLLGWGDVLIVAPYNAQVGAIQALLPEGARVGTVDKFQGQEAPVSIYSMTTSSPEDAPRGMDFLYSRNRLNVATSRARCLAIVVASDELLRVRARSPKQMRLANALCRFVEIASEQGGRPPLGAADGTLGASVSAPRRP